MGIKNREETVPLGLADDSPLITRSKLERSSTATARRHRNPDVEAGPRRRSRAGCSTSDPRRPTTELQKLRDEDGRGLLVLYPIDKDSEPKKGADDRDALDAVDHLIGVALCFPTAKPDTEAADTIQVDAAAPLRSSMTRTSSEYEDPRDHRTR